MFHLLLVVVVFTGTLNNANSFTINVASKEQKADNVTQAPDDMENNPETLEESEGNDHMAIVEGDVILNDDRSSTVHTWPMRNIAYAISPEIGYRSKVITRALAIVSSVSCLTFHPRTTETHYLNFVQDKGCASYVGFQGGKQGVFIGPGCQLGNIVHEILHALGTTHEHTRVDRDRYITIHPENIKRGKESNFHIKDLMSVLKNPYDIVSIMHYGRYVFSRNGQPTIVTHVDKTDKEKVKYMGQRFKMTKLDAQKLRTLYNCDPLSKQANDVFL